MTDMWICPECSRAFGRRNQGHECAPAMSLDEYFSTGHERERQVFEPVHAHLESLGPVHVEPVSVGIFFKRGPRLAELRPKTKWVALAFYLPVKLEHQRFARKVIGTQSANPRWYHVVNLTEAAEVDDQVLDWLTQAYIALD